MGRRKAHVCPRLKGCLDSSATWQPCVAPISHSTQIGHLDTWRVQRACLTLLNEDRLCLKAVKQE